MMRAAVLVVTVVLPHAALAGPSVAALDGPPGSVEIDEPPAPAAAPPKVDPIERMASRASASSGLFAGTALTVPSGRGELSTRISEAGALSTLAMGVTDTTEIWADAGALFDDDGEDEDLESYAVGVRQVIGRGASWQSAVTGAMRKFGGSDDVDELTAVSLGVVGSVCTSSCAVMISASIGFVAARELIVMPSASFQISAGTSTVRVQAEVMTLLAASYGFAGLRFANTRFAVDVGALTVNGDGGGSTLPFGGLALRL